MVQNLETRTLAPHFIEALIEMMETEDEVIQLFPTGTGWLLAGGKPATTISFPLANLLVDKAKYVS